MPIIGSVDIGDIIANLGNDEHGLKSAGPALNSEEQEDEQVYRATWGPVDISTAVGLEPAWDLIWDVNNYYRDLGIVWPYKANKKELRVAYQERDGHVSTRLTYVLKQLLDPQIRSEYDKAPFGSRYRDIYVEELENRLLHVTASELSYSGGTLVTRNDLVRDINHEHEGRRALEGSQHHSTTWDWGFYRLKSRKSEYEDLIIWQAFLVSEFAKRGFARTISIGYIGDSEEPFVVKTWNDKTIFFLNDELPPTPELAETAVSIFCSTIERRNHVSTNKDPRIGRQARS